MRTRADAEVVAELPVVEIVPALAARSGERRRLVVPIPRGVEQRVHGVLDVRRRIGIGQRRRMAVEQRIGLERQLIERKVRRRERDRGGGVGLRVGDGLLRQRVHEVEVDVAEDRERGVGRRARLVRVVDAPQRRELVRREALDAQRQPVDARRPEIGELLPLERPRVRLERHLGVRIERHARANAGQQPVDRRRREETRRAAADEDRDDPAIPDRRKRGFEIGQQRVDVVGLGRLAARLVRIEIAIRALPDAPRNVDVERERRRRRERRPVRNPDADLRGHRFSASSLAISARIALPRCDRSFLRSSGISAPVSPLSTSRKCGS